MTLNASFWALGLSDQPHTGVAEEIERLRVRRVELRAKSREASVASTAAARDLERAQRAFRDARAEHAALGGPADDAKAAERELSKAESGAERAAERERAANDGLAFIDGAVSRLLEANAPEILGQLSADAEKARAQAVEAFAAASRSLAQWEAIALRQEVLLTATGRQDLRGPGDALKQIANQLSEIAAGLPAATLRAPGGPGHAHVAPHDDPDPAVRERARAKVTGG